jgi:DNA-binding transcriptional regulator YdaS (Cro superfamily)
MDTNISSALITAIDLAGGGSAVAEHFGISPAAVSGWLRRGRAPANRCRGLAALTNDRITCHQLDPVTFGPPPKQKRKNS